MVSFNFLTLIYKGFPLFLLFFFLLDNNEKVRQRKKKTPNPYVTNVALMLLMWLMS